ncbi:MAG: polymer-forming cytoskeletal protein [Chloroflexota bacterium]
MKYLRILLILILLITVPAGLALAAGRADKVIEAGDTVNEDLSVISEKLEIAEGATVNGDVAVFGAQATIDGNVTGDLSIFGGEVTLSGNVDGDLVIFGGNLEVAEAADVGGECVSLGGSLVGEGVESLACATARGLDGLRLPNFNAPQPPSTPPTLPNALLFVGRVGAAVGNSLILGLVALVIVSLWPTHFDRVSQAVLSRPLTSGVVGLLTAVAVPSLAALLALISAPLLLICIGLLGYAVVVVMVAVLAAAVLFGWIVIGDLLGQQLARGFKLTTQGRPAAAALGTVTLTLLLGLLSLFHLSVGGWLLIVALASVGLGATALTQFGRRAYPVEKAGY